MDTNDQPTRPASATTSDAAHGPPADGLVPDVTAYAAQLTGSIPAAAQRQLRTLADHIDVEQVTPLHNVQRHTTNRTTNHRLLDLQAEAGRLLAHAADRWQPQQLSLRQRRHALRYLAWLTRQPDAELDNAAAVGLAADLADLNGNITEPVLLRHTHLLATQTTNQLHTIRLLERGEILKDVPPTQKLPPLRDSNASNHLELVCGLLTADRHLVVRKADSRLQATTDHITPEDLGLGPGSRIDLLDGLRRATRRILVQHAGLPPTASATTILVGVTRDRTSGGRPDLHTITHTDVTTDQLLGNSEVTTIALPAITTAVLRRAAATSAPPPGTTLTADLPLQALLQLTAAATSSHPELLKPH